MKKAGAFLVVLAFAFPLFVHAYTSPGKPQGYVSDFANVLSSNDRAGIEQKLSALQKSTGVEVAVVTVSSLGDETIDSYAVALFQDWGIGKKGVDNGLLILVAPNDKKVRIEVGYGLEGAVTDLQAGNIIQDVMIPAFKQNDFAKGITGGVDAVIGILTHSPDAAQFSAPPSGHKGSVKLDPTVIIFIIVFVLSIFGRIFARTKSWWLGGVVGAVTGIVIGLILGSLIGGIIATIILSILGLIYDYIVSKHPPKGPGGTTLWPIFFGPRGGGWGSGGGGGFGGFGGGGSGGGGASGGW